MESQFSDQELHDVALGYKPTTKKVQNLCGELLSTRAALSEINNKLIPEYIEATKRDDAEIQRLTESLSALQEAGNGLFEMLSKCTSIKRKYENNVALRKWMDVRDSTPPEGK